ncbi:pentapeptide repeat-containing protein [Sorangium cellulosum]|uniref:WD40 domain-containing protein n=1 Tax=Sorangium cellulosum TaxID=56 RepID=UPI0006779B06|nr:pentapeptide repeat-containing protein [Sorangium cellulosum]
MANSRIDVLIVTALQDELDAVLELGEDGKAGWTEERARHSFRVFRREVPNVSGLILRVAAAWSGDMGVMAATSTATQLIDELNPACLAMCGICAGRRGEVFLGDVVVADRAYFYDHGKLVAPETCGGELELFQDIKTYNLEDAWKMDAAFFARDLAWSAELVKKRPPSRAAQQRWLLHAVYAHEIGDAAPPQSRDDRKRSCPDWPEIVQALRRESLMEDKPGKLILTDKGRERVEEERLLYFDELPGDPPFRVHVGPIATGAAVREDPKLFERLRRSVRKVLGVEMEAASIAAVADRLGRRSIIAKAVSDFGDHDKDDSFRAFACSASARFLLAFLQKHLDPLDPETGEPPPPPPPPPPPSRPPVEKNRSVRGRFRGPGSDVRGLRDDFLARVERICQLRWPGSEIAAYDAEPPFAGVLLATTQEGRLLKRQVVGVLDQPISAELLGLYVARVESPYRRQEPYLRTTLVHTGTPAPEELLREADAKGVYLQSFEEYQGIIDFKRYLEWQTSRLDSDLIYPPPLYVTQRATVSIAGQEPGPTEDALASLRDLLTAPYPRFALILGDFGTGKTFLLHELARRMGKEGGALVPLLVEMRSLEKQQNLRALLAQHVARADVGWFDPNALLYLLEQGRIALFFDGFDELALRVSYERALDHFDTLLQAARGNAKVVVTSRTQHFLTDHQVKKELAIRAETLPGYRLVKLQPFEHVQIRAFLAKKLGSEEAAEERFGLLDEVKDLLGLSANPRMLGFIAAIGEKELRDAKERFKEITSAKLYEILIGKWLEGEHARVNPPGAPPGLSVEQLWTAVVWTAVYLWRTTARSVSLRQLPEELAQAVSALGAEPIDVGIIHHQLGSGSLLVRDEQAAFSFIHQSVMEWLVAKQAARELIEAGATTMLDVREVSELMADFFIGLAGHGAAVQWARAALAGAEENAVKANAVRVLRRLGEPLEMMGEAAGAHRKLNLEGHDLRGQDLSGQDLRAANLNRANLAGMTLAGANLSGASLVDAKLARADLRDCKLENADLRGADLSLATLVGADLRGAKLDGAIVRGTKFVAARVDEAVHDWLASAHELGSAPPAPDDVKPMVVSASACDAVAWSPNGDLLAIVRDNGVIEIWDTITGIPLKSLVHGVVVRCLDFSPNGTLIVSGAWDNRVRLCEIASGRVLRIFEGHTDSISSVVFSPDGSFIASGSSDDTVRLWDAASGRLIRMLTCDADGVSSVAFSPDGLRLAVGLASGTMRMYEVPHDRVLCTFNGHTDLVNSIAFNPRGVLLASGADDKTVRLWDAVNGRLLRTLRGHAGKAASVAFSPTGTYLASGWHDGAVKLWDVDSGRSMHVLKGHNGSVASVAFNPDGSRLASASWDKSVLLWEPASGRVLSSFVCHADSVRSVAFSPDGSRLASGAWGGALRLWDTSSGHALQLMGNTVGITGVAFSPGGSLLAGASHDWTVRLWDADSGQALRTLEGHKEWVSSVAFSPGGEMVASGSHDKTVRLWAAVTGRALRTLKGHTDGVEAVAFSPDGELLASGARDNTIHLWKPATGPALHALKGHTNVVSSVAFSSDGARLASASWDKTIRLWEPVSGRMVQRLEGHTSIITSVAFSPDSRMLASGAWDNTVRLWDAATGGLLRTITTYAGHVTFSPDGNLLAVASGSTIELYAVATGEHLASFLATAEGWVAFTPDGRYRMHGDLAGSFWHCIGLCRFEPGELDSYLPRPLRLRDVEPLFTFPHSSHLASPG